MRPAGQLSIFPKQFETVAKAVKKIFFHVIFRCILNKIADAYEA
jgi:hypothetical protein